MTGHKQAIMTLEAWTVIKAAEAYVDQLNAFNLLDHPEVQKARQQLAEAVAYRLNTPRDEQVPLVVEDMYSNVVD